MADELARQLQAMTKAQHRVVASAIDRAGREIKIQDAEIAAPPKPTRPIDVRYWDGELIVRFRVTRNTKPDSSWNTDDWTYGGFPVPPPLADEEVFSAALGVYKAEMEVVREVQAQIEVMTPVQRHVLDVAIESAGGDLRTDFGSLVRSLQRESQPIRIYHYDGRFIIRTPNPLMADGPGMGAPYNRN